jgi:hypothetical protein
MSTIEVIGGLGEEDLCEETVLLALQEARAQVRVQQDKTNSVQFRVL